MQSQDNPLNEEYKFDMATMAKAIGEFSGVEDVEEWIRTAEVMAMIARARDTDVLRATIFAMRGEARTWAVNACGTRMITTWKEFKNELRSRFTSTKKTTETLSRFFMTRQAKTYEEYTSLLKDANMVLHGGCVNAEALIKQVIARSPAEVKAILLGSASSGADWSTFMRCAENSAWIAFPEKIVNQVVREGRDKKQHSSRGEARGYCRLHEECDHNTRDCEIIQALERKGWRRAQEKRRERINEITRDSVEESSEKAETKEASHYIRSLGCSKKKNPFSMAAELKGRQLPVIIDTGADVSIINEHNLPKGCAMKKYDATIKSASGDALKVRGIVKDAALVVGGHNIKASLIVTESCPLDHIILGADTLLQNNEAAECLIKEALYERNAKKRHKTTKAKVATERKAEGAVMTAKKALWKKHRNPYERKCRRKRKAALKMKMCKMKELSKRARNSKELPRGKLKRVRLKIDRNLIAGCIPKEGERGVL